MQAIRLLICAGYWGLLTVLQLVPAPGQAIGLPRGATFPGIDFGVHFTAFTLLTLLVLGVRWPKRLGWPVLAVLLLYGLTVESLQGVVPSRTVEVRDYVENILGVAVGTGLYWLIGRLLQARPALRPCDAPWLAVPGELSRQTPTWSSSVAFAVEQRLPSSRPVAPARCHRQA
jgi:hypothetical protein